MLAKMRCPLCGASSVEVKRVLREWLATREKAHMVNGFGLKGERLVRLSESEDLAKDTQLLLDQLEE